ncbi:MAG: GDSL family lipase [Planctomycetes bacterium]|nr:GDSL family lipase [Planctomycetota bacterium]
MLHLILLAALSMQPANPLSNSAPGAQDPMPQVNFAAVPAPRKDQPWIDRNAKLNARAKQGAEKGDIDIVFMGDSITQGWEGAGKPVWEKHFAKRNAANFGISGDRTQHVLYRASMGNLDGLDTPDAGNAPRLAILMIGTNNTGGVRGPAADQSNSAAQINEGVRACVNAIHDKIPGAHILVLGIFPRSEKPDAKRQTLIETNELLKTIGEGGDGERAMSRVHFLDISDKFLEKDGTISKEVMPDFLHLSEKGYQIWAEAILPQVDKYAPAR